MKSNWNDQYLVLKTLSDDKFDHESLKLEACSPNVTITPWGVEKTSKKLKDNKSFGPDNVAKEIIKRTE